MKKQKENKKIATIEVILLVASIFAFSYVLGSSFPVVSAQHTVPEDNKIGTNNPQENPYSKLTLGNAVSTFGGAWTLFKPAEVKEIEGATEKVTPTETAGFWNKLWAGNIEIGVESILYAAVYAAAAYFAVQWVAKQWFGARPGPAKAYAAGAATGVFVAASGAGAAFAKLFVSGAAAGPLGLAFAAVAAIITTLFTWHDEKTETVVFTCGLWQPQAGGNSCEKCNNGLFPCTEYQCASLGASCKIENKGTKEQKCVWYNRMDTEPPIISPWEEALKPNYRYSNNNLASPPNRGINVSYLKSSDGCIPAYTPFSFGVKVDKNAKCSVDIARRKNFSSMLYSLSEGQYLKEHSIELRLPSSSDLEAEGLIPIGSIGNSNKLYVKCLSTNGVESKADLEFSYCIQKGPDLNPPEIVETSIANNSPVSFGTSSVDLTVSIDKPGQCKWSNLDRTYGDMENVMSCATKATQYNAKMLYDCKTTLTSIKDRVNNDFYFRCNGTYNGKMNPVSYMFRLKGTEPLVITKVGPNETIKDSTDPVKVTLTAETSAGAEKGKAICQYSQTGDENDYIAFYNTDSYTHSQPDLGLSAGKYTYYIKCFDSGGNSDTKTTNFTVEIDKSPPMVVRAFHDGNSLKIITNEEGECVYNTQEAMKCNYDFEEGVKMTDDEKEHTVNWDTFANFYIKCKDKYENQPSFGECSIEARPFNLA